MVIVNIKLLNLEIMNPIGCLKIVYTLKVFENTLTISKIFNCNHCFFNRNKQKRRKTKHLFGTAKPGTNSTRDIKLNKKRKILLNMF